jgi:hypothetical protein
MESLKEMVKKLMSRPTEITRIQEEILSIAESQMSIEKEIIEISASIKSDINSTIDANGKKIYTNAESRDSAFIEISNGNTDYLSMKAKSTEIDSKIKSLRIQLDEENNIQRNIRSVLPIFHLLDEN